MKFKTLLAGLVTFFSCSSAISNEPASSSPQTEGRFFSLTEIKSADKQAPEALQYLQASDGTSLAFRPYLPQQAEAVLIFYHGAGAHSGLSYQHLGIGLRDNFKTAVYMPDIRGHGHSDGDRGDTPAADQVWRDINTVVKHVRIKYPKLPIFIGGHSSGAGLALNYSSWDQRASIDGYVFLAPYFGFRSGTNYDKSDNRFEFTSVKTSDFIANAMSGGKLFGHSKAVTFHYPDSVLEQHPEIVTFNTVNMSNALTPYSPDTQFHQLQTFGLWIGQQDEAFNPIKIKAFAETNSDQNATKVIAMVEDENHFSILLKASELVGPWLTQAEK